MNGSQQKVQWYIPAFEKFQGKYWVWGIAESPLLVDDKVIYTPGGHQTTMVALHKHTGETMWEKEWNCKGSISAADGLLYCYEEKQGNLALVEPSPDNFKIVSSFRITKGSGPHWTQPVIHKGVLYIRHGDVLMAYDIKR